MYQFWGKKGVCILFFQLKMKKMSTFQNFKNSFQIKSNVKMKESKCLIHH